MDRSVLVHNTDRASVSPLHALYCESFGARLKGFTFRNAVNPDEGLILVENRDSRIDTAIHMFFVWTDLAVFWIDSGYTVVDRVLAKSWRPMYAASKPARYVLEIHPDRLGDFRIGEQVRFESV